MATSRGAFTDHHLVESERGTLLYRCFNHDILTSICDDVACAVEA